MSALRACGLVPGIEDEARKLTGTNVIMHGRFAPHAVRDGTGTAAARRVIEALGT
ncbi:hypothetical protein K1T35_18425 [Pseudonocardia sp. DSM 110487]|uniref:hypothetical protein n=1 Tax=Pseudonocardia sp. DSM 110487 TaxID=2865833 RepID=UPI001C6A53F4|nr:hypothetical protein [Pseudonocardia sp. DSM 110487]QYN38998.1 hypothetical protein K1T35_18425 [Pseudonocardia sp. DSM 110487]